MLKVSSSTSRLTATVEPFFPTPPAKITDVMKDNDHRPQTTVVTERDVHNSILPKI